MGQKVSPTGFRIGITEPWRSRWYSNKKVEYSRFLLEDQRIRKFVKKQYAFSNIPYIEIERTRERINIILHTAKAGLIIGKKGVTVDKIKSSLEQFIANTQKTKIAVNVEIKEVKKPEVDAQLIAENIAEQMEKRANYRRVMKKAMDVAIENGVLGVKIQISGRLSGAEMARTEAAVLGKVPLQTLDAHVQYGFAEALTTYGLNGIKVWVYHGKYGEEVTNDVPDAQKNKVQKNPKR